MVPLVVARCDTWHRKVALVFSIYQRRFASTSGDSTVSLTFKTVRPCPPTESPDGARSIAVAVVGAPNAGKSTLVNALLGGVKVSSVSSKYNTTRGRVLGVLREGATEVVLTDTPGFVRPRDAVGRKYEPELVNAAVQAIPTADVALLVIDAARRWDDEQRSSYSSIFNLAVSSGCLPLVLANKCDRLVGQQLDEQQKDLASKMYEAEAARHHTRPITDLFGLKRSVLWSWMEEEGVKASMLAGKEGQIQGEGTGEQYGLLGPNMWMPRVDDVDASRASPSSSSPPAYHRLPNLYRAARVPPVLTLSASDGTGIPLLRDALLRLAVPRPWMYAPSQGATDASALDLLTLAVREPLFESLHGDVPYRVRLAVREWKVQGQGQGQMQADVGVAGRFATDEVDTSASGPAALLAGLGRSPSLPPLPTPRPGAYTPPPTLRVSVDVRVPSRGVAGMLLGRGGAPIKSIARQASITFQSMLDAAGGQGVASVAGSYPSLAPYSGCRLKLDLHVAVKDGEAQGKHQDGSVGQAAMLE